MPKISVLTSAIANKIIVSEYVAEGQLEDLEFNIRHKRITSHVMNEVTRIADEIYEKNRIENEKRKDARELKKEHPFVAAKNATAAQLAYLVEFTDMQNEAGDTLPPTPETFLLLSINAQTQLLEGIQKTLIAEKKSSANSSDGMLPAGD